jgi:manganese-dependent inorganic pyrophosphatase
VIERFRQNGMEPSGPTATMLLGAILSDTVILNSPTTTERDRAAADYLARVLAIEATEFGREMFEETSDVSRLPAEEIISRDAKQYEAGGKTICIAQVETVGRSLLERKDELLAALNAERETKGYSVFALMVTDILSQGTELLAVGDRGPLERAFGAPTDDGVVSLPGVMSRKKQVAPKLLDAAAR